MTDKELTRKILGKRPVACEECGGKIKYNGGGEYECINCGYVFLDDFGKVRQYLYENGSTKSSVIAEKTGVDEELISEFLKEGRIEVIEQAGRKLRCDRCGCVIRRGRICSECAKNDVMNFSKEINEYYRDNKNTEEKSEVSDDGREKPHMRYFSSGRRKIGRNR